MIESYQPNEPLLSNYIDYYYTQNHHSPIKNCYTFYPHLRTTISIYKNSNCTLKNGNVYITPSKSPKYTKLITPTPLSPSHIIQEGKIDKLSIVFYSHGINYFTSNPLLKIAPRKVNLFYSFDPSFNSLLDNIFESDHAPEKVLLLDKYFVERLHLNVHFRFEQARILIEDLENVNINVIASRLNLNRKSIYKWFKLFTACSPKMYSNIVKFRTSINQKLTTPELLLSHVAQNHYVDQAHFIKQTKQLTGMTPHHFINSIVRVGNMDTYWTLPKNITK